MKRKDAKGRSGFFYIHMHFTCGYPCWLGNGQMNAKWSKVKSIFWSLILTKLLFSARKQGIGPKNCNFSVAHATWGCYHLLLTFYLEPPTNSIFAYRKEVVVTCALIPCWVRGEVPGCRFLHQRGSVRDGSFPQPQQHHLRSCLAVRTLGTPLKTDLCALAPIRPSTFVPLAKRFHQQHKVPFWNKRFSFCCYSYLFCFCVSYIFF